MSYIACLIIGQYSSASVYYIQFQIDLSVNSSASVKVFIDLEQDLTGSLSVFDAIVNNYSKKENIGYRAIFA